MILFLMVIAVLCYERGYTNAQTISFLIGEGFIYLAIDLSIGRPFRRWWKTTPTYKNLVRSMTRVLDTKIW